MAKNSSIEWTHHTFNPWWGCTKVSQACKNCYAESWARRVGQNIWGAKADRRFFTDAHWREPLKWNEIAGRAGERHRVFCASMADVFEARSELNEWRERLWNLIEITSNLDWLLLTKRPQRVRYYVPWGKDWPSNVWLGTTVELQKWANERIPELISYPAPVRFLSCEPLLGPLNLRPWINKGINWVIAGGESGHGSRPMHPNWVKMLRDQCVKFNVPFHFKQWGHWAPSANTIDHGSKSVMLDDYNGDIAHLIAIGKKNAGRFLEGRTWNELPEAIAYGTKSTIRPAAS